MSGHDPDRTASPVSGSAETARARMAAQLRDRSRTLSQPVQDAFASVPRHVFVPEVGPSAAYRDEAFVIKCGPDGIPVSSSSQPAMMAIMLEQLELQPGHRVLEIGTGSGYNAALMSVLTAPRGRVITLDIDRELVERARASLAAAGFRDVEVRCADGGFGDPAGAPFDRIIVTAGAWDIAPAWLSQLADDGRLVLPLSVRGIELSVALQYSGAAWRSTSACRCGFVRMLGAFAGPQAALRLGGQEPVIAILADGGSADVRAVHAALTGPVTQLSTGLTVADQGELADLDLWLTIAEPQLQRLSVMSPAAGWARPQPVLSLGGLASHTQDPARLGIAAVVRVGDPGQPAQPVESGQPGRPGESGQPGRPGDEGRHDQGEPGQVPVGVWGYGPGGPALARHLAARSLRWHELGRPGAGDISLAVYPPGAPVAIAAGMITLNRPSATIAAGWPGARAA
jgi:protein-L-isoaspartate(D-aspartate) O-methyltransferase